MKTENNDENHPVTAGELARRLKRSTPGIKKAIHRLGIKPAQVLGGISYYQPDTSLAALSAEMRQPNLQS